MFILGINAYHGDVSAVLLRDGELVAAVEEERFRRIKHVAGFPREAIRACLAMAGITGRDIDHVAVSRNPRAHLWRKACSRCASRRPARLLRDRATNYRQVGAIPETVAEALGLAPDATVDRRCTGSSTIRRIWRARSSSRRSTRRPSARSTASAISSARRGRSAAARRLDVIDRTFFPHSLGLLYLAITQYLGFMKYGDEFKVMGLAPYGEPGLRRRSPPARAPARRAASSSSTCRTSSTGRAAPA